MALQNHESSKKIFPSGGIDPWPRIEDYASGGRPFSAPKQGLSWAFQILPYLEQNAVHNLVDSQQLPATKVELYFCPSRRGPTQNPSGSSSLSQRWLMDYAAIVGAPTRNQVGVKNGPLHNARIRDMATYDRYLSDGNICSQNLLWGGTLTHMTPNTSITFGGTPNRIIFPTEGVIVRSSYFVADGTGVAGSPVVHDLQLPKPTSFKQITDGSSNTVVLCEKRIAVSRYEGGSIDDDAGWSDGWDYDTVRLAYCRPASDSGAVKGASASFMTPGSAHSGIFYCAFADGSVHGINYDVDLEAFNRLANKSDGEVLDNIF
ncbi:MAG: DUF1559 domain-containing protein [Planctomycetes bacterium]|nr:DUF1559 domain-containing protein [Planctomycetota bacterium]